MPAIESTASAAINSSAYTALISILIINLVLITGLIALVLNIRKNSAKGPDYGPDLEQIKIEVQGFKALIQRVESAIDREFGQSREESLKAAAQSREDSLKAAAHTRDELTNSLINLRKEISDSLLNLRKEITGSLIPLREEISNSLTRFNTAFSENTKSQNQLLKEKFSDFTKDQAQTGQATAEKINQSIKELKESVEKHLKALQEDNSKQLDQMRLTVDEKLQKTLNARLSQSFQAVGDQLSAVQQGLGEMKTLAKDVGGLKRVLGNVKMSGGLGEMQLSMLLEQILAPDQYEANVKTAKGRSDDLVEFAVKLPGQDSSLDKVWLPIDAKFPKDAYYNLQNAYDQGDAAAFKTAQKNLETAIKKMAKDISSKYIDPPNTTDFAIMFLPFEGIYAEVVKNAPLLEEIRNTYGILVTGPSTLAAILNSLQIGFKTLAIQKQSSQVWKVLGNVKKEFTKFETLLNKAQNNIKTGMNQLDDLMGTRTKAIIRSLNKVEKLDCTPESKSSVHTGTKFIDTEHIKKELT
jgi:DNA recombination protein RmuC